MNKGTALGPEHAVQYACGARRTDTNAHSSSSFSSTSLTLLSLSSSAARYSRPSSAFETLQLRKASSISSPKILPHSAVTLFGHFGERNPPIAPGRCQLLVVERTLLEVLKRSVIVTFPLHVPNGLVDGHMERPQLAHHTDAYHRNARTNPRKPGPRHL